MSKRLGCPSCGCEFLPPHVDEIDALKRDLAAERQTSRAVMAVAEDIAVALKMPPSDQPDGSHNWLAIAEYLQRVVKERDKMKQLVLDGGAVATAIIFDLAQMRTRAEQAETERDRLFAELIVASNRSR